VERGRKARYRVADNQLAARASYDPDLLRDELRALNFADFGCETGLVGTSGTLSGSVKTARRQTGQGGLQPIRLEASQAQITLDRSPAEQVGLDIVGRPRLAGVRALVDRRHSQQPHQPPDPFAVHRMTLGRQPRRHPARAIIGPSQILPIDQRHDRQILRPDLGRFEVHTDERGSASNRHCCDIGSAGFTGSTIACRSARLSCRAFVLKIIFDPQLADLPVQKMGFLGWLRGERGHCSMARVPTIAEDDAKRPNQQGFFER
jgi:hypothetical protein